MGQKTVYGDIRLCHYEPTEQELERMIAEQSRPENLPSWWERDSRLESATESEWVLEWLYYKRRI